MEEQKRVAIIQQFGRTYRAFMTAFEASVGQPLPRWRIIIALYSAERALSQKELVETLRVDPGALTRQLKSLDALGWIARNSDERDNRLTNVTLTASGRAVALEALPRRKAFMNETLSGMSDEALAALSAGLTLLDARIAQVTVVANAADKLATQGASQGASPEAAPAATQPSHSVPG
jgi:DNA-binding MarR family transcriptional regulator